MSPMFAFLGTWLYQVFLFLFNTDEQKEYRKLKEKATNATQYRNAANLQSREHASWRKKDESSEYDYKLIYDRHNSLYNARRNGDVADVMFLLRTSLNRHIGNIHNPSLYAECYGTKDLINAYIEEVCTCLDYIVSLPNLQHNIKQEFISNCRTAYGRTALLLSGGGALSLHHVGVIKSLHEHHSLSRIISGSSGGAIVAAYICLHTEEEFQELLRPGKIDLNVFEEKNTPLYTKLIRLVQTGFFFKAEEFVSTLKRSYGDVTFLEAYNKTRRILNITVTSNTKYEMPSVLNFATAPNVLIWSAVACSCAVPGLFTSFSLMQKDTNGTVSLWTASDHTWIDGSVDNDLPMQRISEMFNVNQFIVCQVNPHVVPFLSKSIIKSRFRHICESIMNLIFQEIKLRVKQVQEFTPLPSLLRKVFGIVDQQYTGDMTITPNIPFIDYLKMLNNPSADFLLKCVLRGEESTWEQIPLAQNLLKVEIKLDELLQELRQQLFTTSVHPLRQNKKMITASNPNLTFYTAKELK
eukprot:NODE_665_length_5410_cov_0.165317.p2 type:complete len:524 gc:universal NODE_665_length_5410_cov_0.165317:155-1726(+)